MFSELAAVVGTVAVVVAVGAGAVTPEHPAHAGRSGHHPSDQRVLANGTGPAVHTP
ncbi:hypothetical protein [Streptomyces sp. NPDC004065]|uniref:hypothetical protein n=1 Tax=Streptomyces sp. NPDC004065 TaxID=3364689 RepID=UPI00385180DD